MTMPLTISVDAMGGDLGPQIAVPAVVESLWAHTHVSFLLFGNQEIINAEIPLKLEKHVRRRLEVRHTSTTVDANDKPSSVIRSKLDSSMAMSMSAVAEGEADVCVSAGNTGALMALGLFQLGVLPEISRPAICSPIPTEKGNCLVLDLGANTDCSAQQLLQFAQLGSLTAECLFGSQSPSIKLLNIGTETIKGNLLIQDCARLIKSQSNLNYQGFIEGNGLFAGEADVVVCDGFSGNIALKASEGTASLIGKRLSQFFKQSWRNKLASFILGKSLSQLEVSLQPEFYNGAILIGLNGVVVKSHGGTDVLGYKAAINTAIESAQHQLPKQLIAKLTDNPITNNEHPR